MRLKFKLITFSVADFPLVVGSDVNKDLGPKAKDTGHKVKAKAKALGYQGQGQGLGVSRPRPRTWVSRPRTWVSRPRPRT